MKNTITKTIFFRNTDGTPEDRYVGKPSFLGQKFTLLGFPVEVVRIIKANPENQIVIVDFRPLVDSKTV